MRKVRLGMPIMDEEFIGANVEDSDTEQPPAANADADQNKNHDQVMESASGLYRNLFHMQPRSTFMCSSFKILYLSFVLLSFQDDMDPMALFDEIMAENRAMSPSRDSVSDAMNDESNRQLPQTPAAGVSPQKLPNVSCRRTIHYCIDI